MNIVKCKVWDRKLVEAHPDWLFIFGDNDTQTGEEGQSVIRGLPNAMGIPTKKLPDWSSFYSDTEFEDNCWKISQALRRILEVLASKKYSAVVLPLQDLGTGLSRLNINAPRTFQFLQDRLKDFLHSDIFFQY